MGIEDYGILLRSQRTGASVAATLEYMSALGYVPDHTYDASQFRPRADSATLRYEDTAYILEALVSWCARGQEEIRMEISVRFAVCQPAAAADKFCEHVYNIASTLDFAAYDGYTHLNGFGPPELNGWERGKFIPQNVAEVSAHALPIVDRLKQKWLKMFYWDEDEPKVAVGQAWAYFKRRHSQGPGSPSRIELPVTSQGRGRVWLQKLPDCSYPVSQVLEHRLPSEPVPEAKPLHAALEVYLLVAGFCPYGLLGAQFVPAQTSELIVQVAVSSSDGAAMSDALPGSTDKVHCGLPVEYATGVLQGATGADSLPLLGSGTLSFNCAAHGRIGSSLVMFKGLAAIVVQLLPLRLETATPELLKAMIEEGLPFTRARANRLS